MENNKNQQESLIKATKDENGCEMATEPGDILNGIDSETLSAIEAIVTANPQFKDMNFVQLNRNLEFRQKLKEYRLNNPLPENAGTIEVLKSVIPKNHVKPNNKLANKITKDIVEEGEFSLVVSGKKAKKEVFTKVMLAYDNRYIDCRGKNIRRMTVKSMTE